MLDLRARLLPTIDEGRSTHDYLVNFYRPGLRRAAIDGQNVADAARRLDRLGFDSALVAQVGQTADVWTLSAWALAATSKLRTAVALRLGLMAPTAAANALATLDRLSGGRTSVHIIQGSTDEHQRADGDLLPKPERYARAHEYLDIFKRILTTTEPFDYEGRFFEVQGAHKLTRPIQSPRPPIAAAGASREGLAFVATHADIYAITTEPLAETRELLYGARSAAQAQGRTLGFWRDCNFVLGPTDDIARERAERIAAEIQDETGAAAVPTQSAGVARSYEAVEQAEWHDRALYTGINRAGGRGGIPFVGSPKTAAEAVLDYYDLGIETFSLGVALTSDEDDELASALMTHIRAGVTRRAAAASQAA